MALPSFLQRKPARVEKRAGPELQPDEAGPVHAARIQARRRLMGAVVLLAIGVLVFPMVFETQPRPIRSDVPIELARRDATPSRPAPAQPRAAVELPVAEPAPPAPALPPAGPALLPSATPSAGPPDAAPQAAPQTAAQAPAPAAPSAVAATSASGAAAAPRSEPVGRAASGGVDRASDARAGRFVVQVGAYTDAGTLRDVRAKVEKLGLKTYTQSIETESGTRTRVRVGPFATRAEADSASARLKGAGLPGNVLVL